MTSHTESRRAFLNSCGSALLLSTTTFTAFTAAALKCGIPRIWTHFPGSPISVRNFAMSRCEDTLLANCWWVSNDAASGSKQFLVQVNFKAAPASMHIVPTVSLPHIVIATGPSGFLLIETDGGLTPATLIDNQWLWGPRRQLDDVPDGIAVMVADSTLILGSSYLWAVDVHTNAIRWMRKDLDPLSVAPSTDNKLFCGCRNGEIVELSAASGCVLRTIRRFRGDVLAIAIDANRSRLACLTLGGRIEVCSLPGGRALWTQECHGAKDLPLTERPNEYCLEMCFSPDGSLLVTAAGGPKWFLTAWDAQDGQRIQTMFGHHGPIHGFTFLSDGTLLSAGLDGTFRLWDPECGMMRRVISIGESIERNRLAQSTAADACHAQASNVISTLIPEATRSERLQRLFVHNS